MLFGHERGEAVVVLGRIFARALQQRLQIDLPRRRRQRRGTRARDRAKTMGLGVLFPELRHWSPTLTALRTPTDVSPRTLKKGLEQRGILIAGGLEPYNNNAIRIGHMGDIRVSDVERTCDALEAVLAEAR